MSGYSTTPNYGLRKPIVGGDQDLWGGDWNLNADTIDTQIKARADSITSVQASLTTYLSLGGGVMTGPITTSGAPTLPLHAANKAYADTFLPLAGGTVSGTINAPTFAVTPSGDALLGSTGPDYSIWADVYGFASLRWNATGWTFDQPVSVGSNLNIDGVLTFAGGPAPYLPLAGGTVTGTVNAPSFIVTPSGDAMLSGGAADYYVWTDAYGFASLRWNATGWTFDQPMSLGDLNVSGNFTVAGSISPNAVLTDHVTFPRDITLTDLIIPGMGIAYADQFGFTVPICDDHGIVIGADSGGTITPVTPLIDTARWDNTLTCGRRGGAGTAATADTTYAQVMELEAPCQVFRLSIPNNSQGNVIIRACVAFSASYNDGINPVDAGFAAVPWTPVTWGNGGLDVDLWAQIDKEQTTTPPTQFTLLPRPSWAANNLSVAWKSTQALNVDTLSDWIRLASLPRTAAPVNRPLLFIRVYVLAGSAAPTPIGGLTLTGAPAAQTGRYEIAFNQVGVDGVTNPGAFTSTTPAATQICHAVQATHNARGITTISYGDSVNNGQGNGQYGYAQMVALALSTPQQPFEVLMSAHTGTNTNVHGREASYRNAWAKASVAYIQCFSRANAEDSAFTVFTQAAADEGFAKALNFAKKCISERCVPILLTSMPWDAITTSGDAVRQNINNKVRAAAAAGFLLLDLDNAFSVPGTPPTFNPAYTNDGFHMNAAGEQVAFNLVLPIVKKALLLP